MNTLLHILNFVIGFMVMLYPMVLEGMVERGSVYVSMLVIGAFLFVLHLFYAVNNLNMDN